MAFEQFEQTYYKQGLIMALEQSHYKSGFDYGL